jgi:hypothetical protein
MRFVEANRTVSHKGADWLRPAIHRRLGGGQCQIDLIAAAQKSQPGWTAVGTVVRFTVPWRHASKLARRHTIHASNVQTRAGARLALNFQLRIQEGQAVLNGYTGEIAATIPRVG